MKDKNMLGSASLNLHHNSLYQKNFPNFSNKNNQTAIEKSNTVNPLSAKNYRANFVAFLGKTMIIDAHAHIESENDPNLKSHFYGNDLGAGILDAAVDIENISGDNLVKQVLVSNITGIDTIDHKAGGQPFQSQRVANEETLRICEKHRKFLPEAVCQPGHASPEEIEELVSQNKFYALKFHPYYLGINANDEVYDPFIEIAKKHELPCVFHSAPGTSDPALIYDLAKRHKDVPFVLYHMNLGSNEDKERAIRIVKESLDKKDANLYLEISWVDMEMDPNKPSLITKAIDTVGADRVIFGTDASLGDFGRRVNSEFLGNKNYDGRIEQIKRNIRANYDPEEAEDIINKIFYENSKKLFKIED
jgi:predicted TIM-barrel fold metal-dependent hydrolase